MLRNFGFSSDFFFIIPIFRVKVDANQSRTSDGTESVWISLSSSSVSSSLLQKFIPIKLQEKVKKTLITDIAIGLKIQQITLWSSLNMSYLKKRKMIGLTFEKLWISQLDCLLKASTNGPEHLQLPNELVRYLSGDINSQTIRVMNRTKIEKRVHQQMCVIEGGNWSGKKTGNRSYWSHLVSTNLAYV